MTLLKKKLRDEFDSYKEELKDFCLNNDLNLNETAFLKLMLSNVLVSILWDAYIFKPDANGILGNIYFFIWLDSLSLSDTIQLIDKSNKTLSQEDKLQLIHPYFTKQDFNNVL